MRFKTISDVRTKLGQAAAAQAERQLTRDVLAQLKPGAGGSIPAAKGESPPAGRARRVTVTLPVPDRKLSPNARCHWAAKATAIRSYRTNACLITHCACVKAGVTGWLRARVTIRFYFASNRRRDKDNCLAMLKSAFDGIADSGLILNDSGLTPMPPEMMVDKLNPRVEITLEREDNS
jgi:Holliday junction resolvase RusA-like endonuclease